MNKKNNTTIKTLITVNSEHVFHNSALLIVLIKINILHSFIV